jgi:hypothetical protein
MWDGDGKGHKITYDPNTFQITTNDIDIIH